MTRPFSRYWPADAHVIGKNITRFHCLYWPAMLISAGLELPRQVAVHGFMTLEGQNISKTTGNLIDPVDLVDELGADPVRYYLLREFASAPTATSPAPSCSTATTPTSRTTSETSSTGRS